MWKLTVIDDGEDAKILEFKEEHNAINIHLALVENGCMVKREKI
jgi:hypothetical protein